MQKLFLKSYIKTRIIIVCIFCYLTSVRLYTFMYSRKYGYLFIHNYLLRSDVSTVRLFAFFWLFLFRCDFCKSSLTHHASITPWVLENNRKLYFIQLNGCGGVVQCSSRNNPHKSPFITSYTTYPLSLLLTNTHTNNFCLPPAPLWGLPSVQNYYPTSMFYSLYLLSRQGRRAQTKKLPETRVLVSWLKEC